MRFKSIILHLVIISIGFTASKVHIVSSSQTKLELNVVVNPITIDDLKPIHISIGLPNSNPPELNIQMYDQTIFDKI